MPWLFTWVQLLAIHEHKLKLIWSEWMVNHRELYWNWCWILLIRASDASKTKKFNKIFHCNKFILWNQLIQMSKTLEEYHGIDALPNTTHVTNSFYSTKFGFPSMYLLHSIQMNVLCLRNYGLHKSITNKLNRKFNWFE